MKRSLLIYSFILLMLAGMPARAQTLALPHGLSWKLIESEFYNSLNELRAQKKLIALTPNTAILDTAAFDQAKYMNKRHTLTHDQSSRKKATPYKRVQYYKGTYPIVGENAILIFIDTPMKTKYARKPVLVSTEKEIADALFLGWKNSPKHYRNMITPEYREAGLGYAFDEKTKQLYCTQVFGGSVQKR